MSLEIAIAENTAAIRELIEAIKQGVPATQAQVAAVVAEAADTKPTKAENPKAEKKAEAPKQEAEEPSAATPEPKEEAAAAEVSLDDVVAATLALGKAGKRQQLVEKLGELGAAKASALPDTEWAGYVAWARAQLEA